MFLPPFTLVTEAGRFGKLGSQLTRLVYLAGWPGDGLSLWRITLVCLLFGCWGSEVQTLRFHGRHFNNQAVLLVIDFIWLKQLSILMCLLVTFMSFFCEMSIQVHCPFGWNCLLSNNWAGWGSLFIQVMTCRYFLQSWVVPWLCFLYWTALWQMQPIVYFCFCFGIISEKSLPHLCQGASLCVS